MSQIIKGIRRWEIEIWPRLLMEIAQAGLDGRARKQ